MLRFVEIFVKSVGRMDGVIGFSGIFSLRKLQ